MTNSTLQNPQNPYLSFLVKASAGTGKTYQLSKRFLCLSAAGTDPSLILTVTFTKKAAAEMRERILQDCRDLLSKPKDAVEFESLMKAFHKSRPDLAPPLSAKETARRILASQQNLNIKTIDSLFAGWVRSFDFEASGKLALPTPMEPLAEYEVEEFSTKAWHQTLEKMRDNKTIMQSLVGIFSEEGFSAVRNRLENLASNSLLIWMGEQKDSPVLQLYPEVTLDDSYSPIEFLDFFAEVKDGLAPGGKKDLESLLSSTPRSCDPAVFMQNLRERGILTKDLTLNGTKFKKLREQHPHVAARLHTYAESIHNREKILILNGIVKIFALLQSTFETTLEELKFAQNRVDHNDLAKASYRLFTSPDALGAQYLIQRGIHHILLDEFQDTNALQWSIFETISKELLSGANHDLADRTGPGTLFIVGDEKQSIYGFREADSELLRQVQRDYDAKLTTVELNASYRTSQILFDVINACFSNPELSCSIENFPTHKTAEAGGQKVKPDIGSFTVSPLFENDDPSLGLAARKGLEKEASFVAAQCRELLNKEEPTIWDKEGQTLRRIKPSDIAILYRTKTHTKEIEAALINEGIVYGKAESHGFFDQAEVQDVFALFRFLCLPGDLLSLCSVLRSPIVGMDDSKLAEILYSTQTVEPYERIKLLCQDHSAAGQILSHALNRDPADLPASQRFLSLMMHLKIIQKYEKAWPHLADRARSHLEQFCQILGQLTATSDLQLLYKIEQIRDQDAKGLQGHHPNAVSLMTIHKSKGLEYPVVFLTDLDDNWTIRTPYWCKANQELFYIGKGEERPIRNLNFDRIIETEYKANHQEHVRMLYVALTRACHHIVVSAHRTKKSGFYSDLVTTMQNLSAQVIPDENQAILRLQRYEVPEAGVKVVPDIPGPTLTTPVMTESVIPAEIYNATPSAEQETQTYKSPQLEYETHYYQAIGLWVHKGLENEVRKKSWDRETNWQAIVRQIGWIDSSHHPLAFSAAQVQLDGVLSSSAWKTLFTDVSVARPEMPLTYLGEKRLVHGFIDLMTEHADGRIQVTDYKSMALPEDNMSEGALRTLCVEKGYSGQIQAYMRGCQLLYPGRKVSGGVFFTASKVYISIDL